MLINSIQSVTLSKFDKLETETGNPLAKLLEPSNPNTHYKSISKLLVS
ncbi:5401_t:CDS:2, partial [Dentiscutata erythropus]